MHRLRLLGFVLLSGCLTSTHVLPRGELPRLASLPPEERGQRVRVVQGFTGAEEPPEHPQPVGVSTVIVVAPQPYYAPAPVAVAQSAKSMSNEAKWWIIIAAVTAVGLAVTEGLRFDGWVRLHPMHPVHMWMDDGSWTWMPLAQIDPDTAAHARKAFVREQEGPWQRLRRAPLDRAGFNYSVLLGTGQVTAFDDERRAGFLSHIELGYFPLHQVGILFDIGLGWRTDRDFTDIFQSRYALELQVFPISAGPLELGGYGEVGFAYHFEDFPDGYEDRRKLLAGGGLVGQIGLTTRLAFTVRAGIAALGGDRVTELTAGISIY